MKKFLSAIDKISLWSGKLASYLFIPLILIIVYTVFMRYVLSNAPDWGFEMTIFLYGIMMFVGGGYTHREKSHVTVDVFSQFLGEKGTTVLEIISSITIIIVCVILTIQSSEAAMESTRILERSIHQTAFNPPIWWFKWFIPFSAVLIILQSLKFLIESIYKLIGKEI